jgi:hypothetical protein
MIPLFASGGIASAIGGVTNAIGERQGAKGAARARARQIAEQNRLQEESDAEVAANLQRTQIDSGIGDARRALFAGTASPSETVLNSRMLDTLSDSGQAKSFADMDLSTQRARENLAIAQNKADMLRKLYGVETDVAGMRGIGARSFGQFGRGVGRSLMKAGLRDNDTSYTNDANDTTANSSGPGGWSRYNPNEAVA